MANILDVLCYSLIIYIAGGVLSLLLSKQEKVAIFISSLSGLVAGIFGVYAVYTLLIHGGTTFYHLYQGPFPFTQMPIRIDKLSAFMIGVISLLSIASSFYSFSYVQEYIGKGAGSMGFFMNTFIASMIALMIVDNAFYFIIFFELMSLSSYFLVISEQKAEAISAGFLYFLIAHAGSILIMISFLVMYFHTPGKSLNFEDFRALSLTPVSASIVFILAFFGFGAKAGMIPLHGWLPRAHPAAPSHASAMMSGVMVKIGVFGIIKVGVDLLSGGEIELWWGVVVLGFGCISSVLGVLYALAEHDIKRLLAYHTVENVGIILMGTGVGLIGISQGNYILASLGFLGALYHLLNHAVFKGLLFLGAGAVIYRLHDKDMEKMGGLAKLMPYTAVAFLVGCMAISALPPFNGFVSEWYTYQGLFAISKEGSVAMRLAGPISIVMLAITGALAAMCFVKVYGVSFCGSPRSVKASKAREVPFSMVLPMVALAIACVFLGVGATWVAPVISSVADALVSNPSPATVATIANLTVPGEVTTLSPALLLVVMIGSVIFPLIVFLVHSSSRLPFRRDADPWACGYEYDARMAQNAGSFTQGLRFMFANLYRIRKTLDIAPAMHRILHGVTEIARKIEPVWDEKIVYPIASAVQSLGGKVQVLQQGDFRIYCLYIVTALIVLLLVAVL